MAATFWQRAAGLGEGASDLLDLDVLETALVLRFADLITVSRAKQMLGLTTEQGEEFEGFLTKLPGHTFDLGAYTLRNRAVFSGARAGLPELDTVENVMLALFFDPPPPPEEP